ncbi:MAG: ABC transporter substrate-binding protein [Lachnospiraceae bacterium]|nr:ABC transporter substrate-binding protein [Lachnospiraceae bacterium]
MKKVLAMFLAAAMVLSLAACASQPAATTAAATEAATTAAATAAATTAAATEAAATTAAATEAPAAEKEPVTIETYIIATEWGDAFDDMMAAFQAEYPWISFENTNRGGGNSGEYLTAAIASNTLPDLIPVDNDELHRTMVNDGLLEDFNKFACAQQIPQSYKDAMTYNGILMGETYGAAFSCMFYNMAILKEAGWEKAPENWQELIACLKDISEKTDCKQPFTVAAGKTTTSWMLFELLIANACGEQLGAGVYEDAFKNGTFEFNAYPEIVEKFNELQPYFLTGTSAANEDDVTTIMTDGQAAVCLAGNWNGNAILDGITEFAGDPSLAVAALPCFNDEGETRWISATAETAMGVTADSNRSAAEEEAIDLFVNFFWNHYAIIQNVAGNVPVIPMTDAVLKEQMTPLVAEMGASPFVTMGFNLWTSEFKDAANRDIQDCIAGLKSMQDAVDAMTELVKTSYKNKQ